MNGGPSSRETPKRKILEPKPFSGGARGQRSGELLMVYGAILEGVAHRE